MTTKETAARIRSDLKAAGFGPKKVSVRCTQGGSVDVEVKDRIDSLDPVREIAERSEKIDRCHMTGEIAAGVNTFVFVRYAY
jgi:hypothetical protein